MGFDDEIDKKVPKFDGDVLKLDGYIRDVLRLWVTMTSQSCKTDGAKAMRISMGWTQAFTQLMRQAYAKWCP